MSSFIKTAGNALFVVGGFFLIFFGVGTKISPKSAQHLPPEESLTNVAHADTPTAYGQGTYYSQGAYYQQGTYYSQSSYWSGDGGSSGGDGDGGCGCGGDGGCK